MIDDRLVELASRLVDGDLDAEAAARLEEEAASNDELAELIARFGSLRRAVRDIAGDMAAPAELDAVLEPLGRAPEAPRRRVRPVYRWLGAAAAAVLGVTVVVEVAQRHPGPALDHGRRSSPATEPDARIFELAPLPTAPAGEERPLGATDRLLSRSVTPPASREPSPLEVIGPLAAAGDSAPQTSRMSTRPGDETSAGRAGDELVGSEDGAIELAQRKAAGELEPDVELDDAPRPMAKAVAGEPTAAGDRDTSGRATVADRVAEVTRAATLEVAGTEIWSGRLAGCEPGRRRLVIEVRNGVIVAAKPAPSDPVKQRRPPWRTAGLIGASVIGVADGKLVAELVIDQQP